MRYVIGGASGFLGSALIRHLEAHGNEVTRLVRSGTPGDDVSLWDPAEGEVDAAVIERADVVINLSGAPVAHWPWTTAYRQEILDSRVMATFTLANAVAASSRKPTMISASGMNHYGTDRGGEMLVEDSGSGSGFLAHVCQEWELATKPAELAGARVCHVRTSAVAHRDGGALKSLVPLFKLGLGGKLGSGKQYFSLISRNDWVRGIEHLATNEASSGAYNFSGPHPTTNAVFTKELAHALHRKAFLAVPSPAMKIALGGLGTELLGSLRVIPKKLLDEGFGFAEPDTALIIEAALRQ